MRDKTQKKLTIKDPTRRFEIQLDAGQIIRDNPGDGTPALVVIRDHRFKEVATSTFNCAQGEQEVDGHQLTDAQIEWLNEQDDFVTDWEAYHYEVLTAQNLNYYA